jgi:hypothetical protein
MGISTSLDANGNGRASQLYELRHPELVSGSMVCLCRQRGTEGNIGPWMLKRVQHDERINEG